MSEQQSCSPGTNTLREVIAGIVDPDAKFQDIEGVQWSRFEIQRRELAYRKADSILGILPVAQPSLGRQRVAEYICYRFLCDRGDCNKCEPSAVAIEHADTIAALYAVPPSPGAGEWQPIETAPRNRVIVARNANDDRFQVWWQDAAFKGFPIPGGIFCVPFLTEWSPAMSSTQDRTP